MEKLRTLIIDDEAPARDLLWLLLQESPIVELLGACEDGHSAIAEIQKQKPNLIFLDIQMPEVSGFDVLRAIPQEQLPYVIFVTAYDQYAIQAFEVNAIDYLLKPFDDERFAKALTRAKTAFEDRAARGWSDQIRNLLGQVTPEEQPTYLRKLSVKVGSKIKFIPLEEVIWIEAENQYIRIHTATASYLQRQALSKLEALLSPKDFFRIHRSAIVRLSAIRQIEPYFKGDYLVYLEGEVKVKLSRYRVDGLRTIMPW